MSASSAPQPPDEGAGAEVLDVQRATERSFRKRTVAWLVAAGVVSLAATLIIPALDDDTAPPEPVASNSAYSRSAIGHEAFVTLMRSLGLPVTVSRSRPADRAGPRRPLLIAEPLEFEPGALRDMVVRALGRGAPVVVVLPKWRGDPLRSHPGWVGALSRVSPEALATVGDELSEAVYEARGLRATMDAQAVRELPSRAAAWRATWATPTEIAPPTGQVVDADRWGLRPLLWVDGAEGERTPTAMIGVVEGAELYVVTDPDLLSTRGLAVGDHAEVLFTFFTSYLEAEHLVVDELMHGFPPKSETIWSELATFPLVLLSAHLLGLLALVLWATTGRFGAPAPRPPRIPAGKHTLIENTASLLALGGHAGHGLREYLRGSLRAVARDLGLPLSLSDAARLDTLSRAGRERGVEVDIAAVAERAAAVRDSPRDARRAVALARDIYRFRTEMAHGARGSR